MVAMGDVADTKAVHSEGLAFQAEACWEKEELDKKQHLEKVTEEFIKASYLIWMHHYSEKCIKDNPKKHMSVLKKLRPKTAYLDALKLNIIIRVVVFG